MRPRQYLLPADSPERSRMRYLTRLIRIQDEQKQRVHPSKKANWKKFCRRCGVDVSALAYRVTVCERCQQQGAGERQINNMLRLIGVQK